jgi:hypothetical protein
MPFQCLFKQVSAVSTAFHRLSSKECLAHCSLTELIWRTPPAGNGLQHFCKTINPAIFARGYRAYWTWLSKMDALLTASPQTTIARPGLPCFLHAFSGAAFLKLSPAQSLLLTNSCEQTINTLL